MTTESPRCAWCSCGDVCGFEDQPVENCPVRTIDDGKEPTNADVVRLIGILMTGVNQRFAQVMRLIDWHGHKPGDRK